jgi:phosphoribosyl 1,2-cyclic phosphodiesterase
MAGGGTRRAMDGVMKVWVLGSGSRGNAIVVDNGSTRVLVDAGFSARELKRRFAAAAIAPESVEGLIVTHEHGDHSCGALRSARRWKWSVHATRGTVAAMPELEYADVRSFDAGDTLTFSSMTVQTVQTSHDANDPVAVVATDTASGARAAVVTDLGRESLHLRAVLREVDVLVLESNHDDVMLARGPYPISVQRRIASGTGHLSNREASALARACVHSGLQHLVLAHISQNCNTPDHALAAASAALARSRFRGRVTAAEQDTVHGAFVAASRGGRAVQLSLGV